MNLTDLELEVAIADLRGYCSRLSHGRVTLVVDRYDRQTIAHHLEADRLTTNDLERLMREPPHKEVARLRSKKVEGGTA